MKRKPPYYELDQETRTLVELVVLWARQLEQVQHTPSDMNSVIETVERRLLLNPPRDPQRQISADVVALRPFRVITTNKSEHQNEPK